jgi:hypothetical protein
MLLRNREYNEAENWLNHTTGFAATACRCRSASSASAKGAKEAVDLVNRPIGLPPWPAGKRLQVKAVANILQQL